MLSGHLIVWRPLLLLPSIFPSIGNFSNESSVSIWWPKYWNFSFSISPSSDYSGLISLTTDWIDLLVVQTIRSLLQHHSLKASVLQHSAFFTIQLSQLYVATGKTTALDYTDLCWQSSLCFSIHCLGVSSLSCQEAITFFFMAAVTIHSDFGAPEEEICHCLHHFPLYFPWSNGARCHDFSFVFFCLFFF